MQHFYYSLLLLIDIIILHFISTCFLFLIFCGILIMVINLEKLEKKVLIILKSLAVLFIFWYSSYFRLIPIKLFKLDVTHLSFSMKVILSTFSNIILVFILFFLYRKDLKKDLKKFLKNKAEYLDIGLVWWMVGLFIMVVSNFILNNVFKAGGANNEEVVQKMIKSLPLLMIVDAGIIAPFIEEIVFRKTIKDVCSNKWIFYILSFILFGGAHVIGSATVITDYLYIIPYGVLGLVFAVMYQKTETIFTSMSMHMFHNLILIFLSIITGFLR